jgi:hypothetical protein
MKQHPFLVPRGDVPDPLPPILTRCVLSLVLFYNQPPEKMASTRLSLRSVPLVAFLLASTVSALPGSVAKRTDEAAVASYQALGCYVDNASNIRILSATKYTDDYMTTNGCSNFCSKYKYFGLEFGRECYCGDALASTNSADPKCSMACSGNKQEICGGRSAINVYQNLAYVPRKPAEIPGIPYVGCFVDTAAHLLPDKIITGDDMTAAKCAVNCADYLYFGTEFGRECYCGDIPPPTAAPETECSKPCAGDDKELCGGSKRLSVYGPRVLLTPVPEVSNFAYQGCYTDNTARRTLNGKIFYDSQNMTLGACAAACKGYGWFGVEHSTECYCGTTLDPASQKKPDSDCKAKCIGDNTEVCGGNARLSMYASLDPTDGSVHNLDTVLGFKYQSCWSDDVNNRSLTAVDYRSDGMTIGKCAEKCQDYKYIGLEYSRECFCGNELGGVLADNYECGLICMGDKQEWCGGRHHFNLYTNTNFGSAAPGGGSSSTSSAPTESQSTSAAPADTQSASPLVDAQSTSTYADSQSTSTYADIQSTSTYADSQTTSSDPRTTTSDAAGAATSTSSPVDVATTTSSIEEPGYTTTSTAPSTTRGPADSSNSVADSTSPCTTSATTTSAAGSTTSVSVIGSTTSYPGQVGTTASSASAPGKTCNAEYHDVTAPFLISLKTELDVGYWQVTKSLLSFLSFSFVSGFKESKAWCLSFKASLLLQSSTASRTIACARGATYQVTLRYKVSGAATIGLNVGDNAIGNFGIKKYGDKSKVGSWDTIIVQVTPATETLVMDLTADIGFLAGKVDVAFDGVEVKMIAASTYKAPTQLSGTVAITNFRSGAQVWGNVKYLLSAWESKSTSVTSYVLSSASSPGRAGSAYCRKIAFSVPKIDFAQYIMHSFNGYISAALPKNQQYIVQVKVKSSDSDGCTIRSSLQASGSMLLSGCADEWQTFETVKFLPGANLLFQIHVSCPATGYNAKVWIDDVVLVPVA